MKICVLKEIPVFFIRAAVLSVVICGAPAVAIANPETTSCKMLEVLSQNKIEEIEPTLNDFAARWLPQSRNGAISQLTELLKTEPFVGGSVHRITKLGNDLEEHIVLLRLRMGEVAAMRLRYEWSPDGLTLAGMDFKRQVADLTTLSFVSVPEEVICS
jgi:hypothetical protein